MSAENWITLLAALLAGGGIASLINALVARRKAGSEIKHTDAGTGKTEAETTDIIVRAAGSAVELVRKELEKQIQGVSDENGKLRCELNALRAENATLREIQGRHDKEILELQAIVERFDEVLGGAHVLYDQVVELHGEPKYKPPERRKK